MIGLWLIGSLEWVILGIFKSLWSFRRNYIPNFSIKNWLGLILLGIFIVTVKGGGSEEVLEVTPHLVFHSVCPYFLL